MNRLNPEQVAPYLRRLGVNAPGPPSLNELHLAHLQNIPFENLDIHLQRPISLELPAVYRKIVQQRRGGYCYELNSLFAALLRNLGYGVQLLSARVARADGTFGPEFDHLALQVAAEGQWFLADVGFGDAFLKPLPLRHGFTRREGQKTVKLTRDGEGWTYLEDRGDGFQPQYAFTLTPQRIADFAGMNRWQQTSPGSHFTRKRVVSRATPQGRVSLSGNSLITSENGVRHEQQLKADEVGPALEAHFGLVLG